MKFEETKSGEKLIVGGKKWKQKKKEETKDFTLEKFKDEVKIRTSLISLRTIISQIEREEMKIDGKDLDEKGLVEDMWSDCEEDEEEQALEGCVSILFRILSYVFRKSKRIFPRTPSFWLRTALLPSPLLAPVH